MTTSTIASTDILSALLEANNQVLYELDGVTITGTLDLRHQNIHKALLIKNCVFAEEVDFAYCVFDRLVSLIENRFEQSLSSQEAVFQKGLVALGNVFAGRGTTADFAFSSFGDLLRCDGTVFGGDVVFKGIECGGPALFGGTQFESGDALADFFHATFDGGLNCSEAVFSGGARFEGIQCGGPALFHATKFKSENALADFLRATFDGGLECDEALFSGDVLFEGIQCGGQALFRDAKFTNGEKTVNFFMARLDGVLECDGTVFSGGARFDGIQCGGPASFTATKFKSENALADFLRATFDSGLECNGAVFSGGARFAGIECGGPALFGGTQFESEDALADFFRATFDGGLDCSEAVFSGGARFEGIQCGGPALFHATKFKSENALADFLRATFDGGLECDEALFSGDVLFEGIQCGGPALFGATEFEKAVRFSLSSFETSLELVNTRFGGDLELNEASIGRLNLNGLTLQSDHVDLRRCEIRAFTGTQVDNLKLLEAQRSDWFSRKPYVELENHCRQIGDDIEADRIYRMGRTAHRQHAVQKGTKTRWSRTRVVFDWLLGLLVGYGTQTWRLVVPFLGFLGIGLGLYWADGALVPMVELDPADLAGPLLLRRLLYRLLYVVDLLVPVDLRAAEMWQPATFAGEIYSVVLVVAGWLLVPLLIASLTGVLKRE